MFIIMLCQIYGDCERPKTHKQNKQQTNPVKNQNGSNNNNVKNNRKR